jgi:hypothetical protein
MHLFTEGRQSIYRDDDDFSFHVTFITLSVATDWPWMVARIAGGSSSLPRRVAAEHGLSKGGWRALAQPRTGLCAGQSPRGAPARTHRPSRSPRRTRTRPGAAPRAWQGRARGRCAHCPRGSRDGPDRQERLQPPPQLAEAPPPRPSCADLRPARSGTAPAPPRFAADAPPLETRCRKCEQR